MAEGNESSNPHNMLHLEASEHTTGREGGRYAGGAGWDSGGLRGGARGWLSSGLSRGYNGQRTTDNQVLRGSRNNQPGGNP